MKEFKYYYKTPCGEIIVLTYNKPYNNFEIDYELLLLIENKKLKYAN